MGRLDYHPITVRKRPHFQPVGATLFVTFRLAGSIPKAIVRYYKAQSEWLKDQLRRVDGISGETPSADHASWLFQIDKLNREWFLKCEEILHREAVGPTWLRDERIAATVAENLHRLDGDAYRLDAFTIMSNHVHTVFRPFFNKELIEEVLRSQASIVDGVAPLAKIMQTIKGRSARACNLTLGRSGGFWDHESFDHVIRAGRFHKTIRYVLNNPVKIGLVQNWEDYRWNYCRRELIDNFRTQPMSDML